MRQVSHSSLQEGLVVFKFHFTQQKTTSPLCFFYNGSHCSQAPSKKRINEEVKVVKAAAASSQCCHSGFLLSRDGSRDRQRCAEMRSHSRGGGAQRRLLDGGKSFR